jgi:hypothetical protein
MIGSQPELFDREAGPAPERHDFPDLDSYLLTWRIWRAQRRDGELTDAERDAQFGAQVWKLGYPEDWRP